MEKLYVACDLGTRVGRIMLGTLNNGTLAMGELRRFANPPIQEKKSLSWDISRIYQEILLGLRELGSQEANVQSVSCTAWGADYLLFASDGSLLAPAFHHGDPRGTEGLKKLQTKVAGGLGFVHAETGSPAVATSTLAQLAVENSRRLKKAHCLLPIADGFNYLLSGVPAVELSSASTTQLFNPVNHQWSDHLIQDLELRRELFPLIASSGMKLGSLRPELAQDAKLDGVHVVATCSSESAAALAGLPLEPNRDWAYLRVGEETVIGAELPAPLINEVTRKLNYTNELSYGGAANFHRRTVGLSILNECKRYWLDQDRELSEDVLFHLATTSPAFESLINPADARFAEPGDMPLKIQAFCRETGQEVPRKPGSIIRCVLESLALHYRKTLAELEVLTGRNFALLYLYGGNENTLLNNFISNALQLPVVLVSPDAGPLGNVLVQSLALGHIPSLQAGREILRRSFRTQAIIPHPVPWDAAAERLLNLIGHSGEPVTA
ncbi:MAG: FGGY family carbohydrate kinase [Verrucomicrobiota bacterium]